MLYELQYVASSYNTLQWFSESSRNSPLSFFTTSHGPFSHRNHGFGSMPSHLWLWETYTSCAHIYTRVFNTFFTVIFKQWSKFQRPSAQKVNQHRPTSLTETAAPVAGVTKFPSSKGLHFAPRSLRPGAWQHPNKMGVQLTFQRYQRWQRFLTADYREYVAIHHASFHGSSDDSVRSKVCQINCIWQPFAELSFFGGIWGCQICNSWNTSLWP